jgi:hypothetical protein
MELYEDPNEGEAQLSLVRNEVREMPWMRLAGRDKRQEVGGRRERKGGKREGARVLVGDCCSDWLVGCLAESQLERIGSLARKGK